MSYSYCTSTANTLWETSKSVVSYTAIPLLFSGLFTLQVFQKDLLKKIDIACCRELNATVCQSYSTQTNSMFGSNHAFCHQALKEVQVANTVALAVLGSLGGLAIVGSTGLCLYKIWQQRRRSPYQRIL